MRASKHRPPQLFTARYQNPNLAEHPAGKVRITLTGPRFRLPYKLAGSIMQLAPTWSMMHKPEREFAQLYVQLLEQRGGIHFFARRFEAIANDAGVDELVLLCWEDLRKPGAWCHRRILAAWLEDQTGQVVEELADGPEQLEL